MAELDRRTLIAGASLIGAAALVRAAKAGQLDPPMGPVAPTGKSLADIEPRTPINLNTVPGDALAAHVITQPGSYYLTGDVEAPPSKNAILVVAPGNVAIDLRGFTIRGVGGSRAGILCSGAPGPSYVEISDGFIRDCDGDGIDGGNAAVIEVHDVHVSRCDRGIVARGTCIIEACHVERCASHGVLIEPIQPPTSSTVCIVIDDCECRACGGHGFAILGDWSGIDAALHIGDCDAVGNAIDGFHSDISTGSARAGGKVCRALAPVVKSVSNGRYGLYFSTTPNPGGVADRSVGQYEGVLCAFNGQGGIRLSNVHADLTGCDCSDNQGHGFEFDSVDGEIESSVASRNTGHGFLLTNACAASVCDCTAYSNTEDGVRLDSTCTGLSITECECRGNTTGFRVDGPNNLLLWNTASGNGLNYQVAGTPIVVVTPADLPGNDNPHANYSF